MAYDLNDYISRRYKSWLDYSTFQCTRHQMPDQSGDVLNYVLETILTTKREKAISLLNSDVTRLTRTGKQTNSKITSLDCYILQAIKFSCIFKSSSYQLKFGAMPYDRAVEMTEVMAFSDDCDCTDHCKKQRFINVDATLLVNDIRKGDAELFRYIYQHDGNFNAFKGRIAPEQVKRKRRFNRRRLNKRERESLLKKRCKCIINSIKNNLVWEI